jgi:hypothetical protein
MTKSRMEIKIELAAKREELAAKEKELENFELDVDDYADEYEQMIDDSYPEVNIGVTFNPSYVLKNLDETAYRCGLNDYVDGIDITETQGYKDIQEEIDGLQYEIDELESELEADNE